MSGLSSILCLLVGIAVPCGVLFWIVRRGSNQLSSADAYKAVARDLGLKLDTRGIGLQGFHKGRHLWFGQVLLGPDRRTEVHGVLGLRKPIGYGLTLRSRKRKRTESGLSTADEDFDRLYSSNAVQIELAKLLLNEPVRTAAIRLHALCNEVDISDDLIRIKLSTPERNAERLAEIIKQMEDFADTLESQRSQTGTSEEVCELQLNWQALCEKHGWSYDDAYPSITVTHEWGTLSATPRWVNSEFVSELRVHFSTVRDTGFRLTPQRGPSAPWLTGQDIQVRDPSFDKAFVIKGYHPDNVRNRLHAEARTLLLDLLRTGPFEINDDWIRIPVGPVDAFKLGKVIKHTIKTAEAISID